VAAIGPHGYRPDPIGSCDPKAWKGICREHGIGRATANRRREYGLAVTVWWLNAKRISQLMSAQKGHCELTGLPLDLDGVNGDPAMFAPLDRMEGPVQENRWPPPVLRSWHADREPYRRQSRRLPLFRHAERCPRALKAASWFLRFDMSVLQFLEDQQTIKS